MDIRMCRGTNCPVREKCYRFTAPPSEYWQSFFSEVPIRIEDGKLKCDYYWGDNDPFAELNQFANKEQ
jgi:hypothetical protein